MSNVQITQELFLKLIKHHLCGIDGFEDEIKAELQLKLDAQVKRELYSQYKTGSTEADREAARQKYLDKVGIPKNFRW